LIDSSVLIAAERGRLDLAAKLSSLGEEPVALAAISASELLHGVRRAATSAQRIQREAFVERVLSSIDVAPSIWSSRAFTQSAQQRCTRRPWERTMPDRRDRDHTRIPGCDARPSQLPQGTRPPRLALVSAHLPQHLVAPRALAH
jgi:predicted nucleic acid-binding protein